MNCNCPNCSSESTQLLSIAYGSGIYTSEAVTRKESTSQHIHTTVTVNQSELSRQAAPPEKLSVLFSLKFYGIIALIVALLLAWLLPNGKIWSILTQCAFLGIIGFGIYDAYQSFVFNRTEWVARMTEWQRRYMCMRCGAVFVPEAAAAKNGN